MEGVLEKVTLVGAELSGKVEGGDDGVKNGGRRHTEQLKGVRIENRAESCSYHEQSSFPGELPQSKCNFLR